MILLKSFFFPLVLDIIPNFFHLIHFCWMKCRFDFLWTKRAFAFFLSRLASCCWGNLIPLSKCYVKYCTRCKYQKVEGNSSDEYLSNKYHIVTIWNMSMWMLIIELILQIVLVNNAASFPALIWLQLICLLTSLSARYIRNQSPSVAHVGLVSGLAYPPAHPRVP